MEDLVVFRSPDRRHKASFLVNGRESICLAEPVQKGVLVTRFGGMGEVLDQAYFDGGKVESALSAYLGASIKCITVDVDKYEGVVVKASCTSCNGVVMRELDSKKPEEILEVPVIPLFTCSSCGKRFYNMSDSYLRKLVEQNRDMFEKDDIMEKERDGDAFINILNENIIRVFASKKISRLVIEK